MSRFRELPIWTPMAALLLASGWLLPNAERPWVAFHKDAFVALVLGVVGCIAVLHPSFKRGAVRVDWVALCLACLGALVLLQFAVGILPFKSSASIGYLYFMGAALAVVLGRYIEHQKPGSVALLLFTAFLFAAWLTTGTMLVQAFELSQFPIYIARIASGTRPYGNLMQPNNAATLLLLGCAALYWLRQQQAIGLKVWLFSTLYLLAFVVLSASRIGYLSACLLMSWGVVLAARARQPREMFALAFLIGSFVALIASRSLWGLNADGADPLQRTLAGHRLQVYSAFLTALMDQPWTGFGFDRSVMAQLRAFELGHALPGFFGWTHNFLLDVAIWFGIPMALTLAGTLAWAAWAALRNLNADQANPLMIALFIFFMHAMVELPHAYAYFLFPAALLLGGLLSHSRISTLSVPRAIVGLLLLGQLCGLVIVARDYFEVERTFYAWRFKEARIGTYHPVEAPKVQLLDNFEVLMGLLHTEMNAEVDAVRIEAFRNAVYQFPSAHAMQHLAVVAAHSGQAQIAREMSHLAMAISDEGDYRILTHRWGELRQLYPKLRPEMWELPPTAN